MMLANNSTSGDLNHLTGKQHKSLCKALKSAIQEKETLERMMLYELKEKLCNIPKANTYPALIFNLVEWAESKGKIRQLVIAASLENPGNSLLQQFVQDHLHVLLGLDRLPLPNNDLLTSLLQVLTSINDFTETVLSACTKTLPDIETSSPDLREQLRTNELSHSVKWLILLDLFLKNWGCNDEGQLYIVLFVQNLEFLKTGATQTALTQWLNALPESIRPVSIVFEPEMYPERPSDEALRNLQAYFLITVEPLATSDPDEDKFGVNGYVVTRLGDEDRYTKFESISLQVAPSKEANKSSHKEPYYTLEQINDELPEWLMKATELIVNQGVEIQKYYHLELPPVADLAVEFWLPFEHLSAAIETWTIYGQPTRLKRRNRILGREYRVLVRSYDRFSDSDSFNNLIRTWQALVTLSQNPADPTLPCTTHLNSWTHWESLKRELNQACLSLSLTCPLCSQQYQKQREELFSWMLEKGIPLLLWSRCVDLTDDQSTALRQRMQGMLMADALNQLEQLIETIRQTRTIDEYRLALWCDEPKRIIELKEFRERGRLRA
jgi:hypothetical protein